MIYNSSSTTSSELYLPPSQFEVQPPQETPTAVKVALFVGGGILFTVGMLAISYGGNGSACFCLGSVALTIGVLMIGGSFLVHHAGQQRKKNLREHPPSFAKDLEKYEKMINSEKGTIWRTKVPKYLDYYFNTNTHQDLQEATQKDVKRLDVFFEKTLTTEHTKLTERISTSSIINKEQAFDLCNQTTLNQFNDIISFRYMLQSQKGNPLINISRKEKTRSSISFFNMDEKWFIKYQISLTSFSLEPEKVFGYFNITTIVDLETGDAVVSWNSPEK